MFDFAAAAWIFWPVSDEPVKLTARMSMCEVSDVPAGLPWPEITLTTPGGKPASRKNLAAYKDYFGSVAGMLGLG